MSCPESATFIPAVVECDTADDSDGDGDVEGVQTDTAGDVASSASASQVPEGFDRIDKRLRLSNLSSLSRYKVK